MKKVLFALMALMGLMCHQTQAQCDTVRVFPWTNNFYTDFGCWGQLGDSSSLWRLNADDTYSFANAAYIAAPADSVADGCVLVSPALALPADTANMQLSFKTRRVGAAVNLRVLVSTGLRENLADYDTLLNVTPSGSNTYEVNLSAYAGQTVYVAFSVQKPNATNIVTFFGVGSVNIVSDRMPQGYWYGQNIAVRTGDTVEHEFDLTHGLENDSNTVFTWHSTMVEAGLATMVEEVTDMYQYYGYDSVRTLPRSIYRLIYHTQGTDTMTLTVSNIYGTITLQSVSSVYDCQPIATFPTVLEYNLFALCGGGENLYPYGSYNSYTFTDEDGNTYTGTNYYLRSNSNYGDRGYLVTPPIVVPAEGDPISLMLHYRHGPLEVRATTADVTDTALFTDLLFTEPGNSFLRTRKVSLAAYAGDTVRLAIIHKGGTLLDIMPDMNVDYDTLPFVHSIALPTKTRTDSSTLCTATLRYGATEELHYTWTSALGGTFVTNALGDSAWVTYSTGGIDTVTVTVTNAYGSHSKTGTLRVIDCTPQTILPWKETFYDGIPCWWKPDSSNWYTDNPYAYNDNYRALISMYSNNDEWIVSKAITIPADTAAMTILEWEDKADMGNVSHQPNYSVLVSTSADRTDLTAYDTLLTITSGVVNAGSGWRNKTLRNVSLAAYAGQTVHVAFCSHPAYYAGESGLSTEKLIIDNVTVRTASTPLITLASNASTYYWGDTARFTAILVEGSPNGLTYTWHSTLLDSTITINSNLLTLNYPVSGTDTLTVIATNAYGSDTAMVVVSSQIITQPEVTLQHTEANIGVPSVYTALLNRCITTGLTYTWHSTMLDSTITINSNLFTLNYTQSGVDTVTVIASTLYGVDTAVAVVSVQNCAPRVLPYFENFSGIVATDAATAGNLPECWNYYWNGSNAAYAPHVITTGGYQYMNDLPDNALFFVAGSSTGYGSTAIVRLPRFADSLQHLALALDYRFESNGRGTLTVGWFDNNEVFHSVKSLTSHAGSYLRDTVLFTDHIAANYRIALWWEYGSSWYAAAVDNIEVFVDNSIHAPANLAVDNIGAHSARVTWAAVDSASAYHVRINGVVDTTVSGLACNLTGLSSHTEYTVQVAAIVGTETGRYASTTFTTLCGTVPMPYYNDFSQGESSVECWTSSNLNQFYQSGYMIIWSGLSTKPSYQTTPIVAHPGNQMEVSFRARKYGTSTTESGRLIVGVMTDPADTTTFTAIDTFVTTSWNEYRFITRTLDTTPVAIAFCVGTGDGEFCNVAIDDLSIEVPIACASLATAEAVSMGPTSAMISWQYGAFGAQSADGVLVDLYDTTANITTHFVAYGTDTLLTGLPLRHVFRAELRALCGTDTSEAVSVTFAPEAAACAEIAGDYDYSAYMYCNPIMGDKNYGYSQTLYPAAFAASVDTLYGIALRMAGNYSETRTLDVYIGQTTADTLTSPVSVATHTLAVQNYIFSPTTGWAKILFDNPVPLDGVSNLIVTIDDNTGDWGNSMSTNAHYATPGVMLYYDERFYYTENVDPVALGFDVSRTNKIPDLQLLGHCATERCLQPVIAVEPDSNMLLVSWQQRGSESFWQVEYRREGNSNWLLADSTANTSYAITGLNASTPYEVRVGSVCGDSVIYSNTVRSYTPCGAVSLPYHHDFTIDNTCWTIHNNYSSSAVGLDLDGSWPVASPAVNGNISLTAVRFKISGNPNWNPVVKVGVGGADGENAVWLDSIMLSHSDVREYTVYLTGYNGNEHHVLFQADDPYARMREVTFESVGCQAVHHVDISQLTDTSVLLSWPPVSVDGGEWAVYLDDSLVAVTTTPSYLLGGLESGTDYTVAVREICWAGDTAEATTVSFTTLCPTQSLPWSEDFEGYPTSPAYTTDVVIPCWHTILPAINTSSYVSLVSIGSLHSSRALKFYDHIYVTQHTPNVFIYAASSLVNTEGHAATVQFDLDVARVPQSPDQPFSFQAGIMTDVTDTTTFIPMTIVTTPGNMHCSFSTDSNSQFSVAFRFCGDISAFVDNLSVTAVPLPTHDLTLLVNDSTRGTVSGGGTYEEGTNVTITATPNEGYHFVVWSDSVTLATRTVKVDTDTTLTAYFAPDTLPIPPDTVWYTVTVNRVCRNGYEDIPDDYVTGEGRYIEGSTVTLTGFVGGDEISLSYWIDEMGDTIFDNPYSFVINSDRTFTAVFTAYGGIGDVEGADFHLYPNPATTTVTVETDMPTTLTLTDATGRECGRWKVESGKNTIDISSLPAGVYFVRLAGTNNVRKLIIR